MPYHRQHKFSLSKRTVSGLLLLLFFVVLFLGRVVMPSSIVRFVHATGEPLWQKQDVIRKEVSGILKLFGTRGKIVAENMALTLEKERLTESLVDQRLLKEENSRLLKALNRDSKSKKLIAGVILHPNSSLYDTLIIDAGEDMKIKVGSKVFATSQLLVGIIDEVYKESSRVRLFSSPGYETIATFGDSNGEFTAIGNGGGNIVIEIPRDVAVSLGDFVRTSGLLGDYFAVVADVKVRPVDSFQIAQARTPINIYTVPIVFVEI